MIRMRWRTDGSRLGIFGNDRPHKTSRSLRMRLSILYSGLTLLTFALLMPFLYFSVRFAMIAVVDRSLDTALIQALDELNLNNGRATFADDDDPQEIAEDLKKWEEITSRFSERFEEIETSARLVTSDGKVRGGIGDFNNVPVWTIVESGYHTHSHDDESWRVYNLELSGRDGHIDAWLQVTAPLDFVQATLRIFVITLTLLFPFLTLFAAVGSYALAGKALRPIEKVTRAAAAIDENELSRRLDSTDTVTEIAGLVESFNRMLSRIESAFARERRFVTDAAHELRTPLTVLKGQIGVAVAEERTAAEYRRTLIDMEEYVDRLSLLSNDLLNMMRMEQGKMGGPSEEMDLSGLVSATIDQLTPRIREKDISLSFPHSAPVRINGRVDQIIRLLLNLLDNAVKYTPEGGRIEINLERKDTTAQVSFANSGPGIPAADLERVFDRFFRVGKDRSRVTGGSGLGLSIAREIARSHGGKIMVHSKPGVETLFVVIFPATE
jgi:heavy metal sensor kinase